MNDNVEGKKIDHIGIAVLDLDEAVMRYEMLLGTRCSHREVVESEQVETAFFKTGESYIELLAASGPDSVLLRFLEKRGEGIHHIAFRVADLEEEMQRMVMSGFRLLNEPVRGAGKKRIVFLHPKDSNGALIELCQRIE